MEESCSLAGCPVDMLIMYKSELHAGCTTSTWLVHTRRLRAHWLPLVVVSLPDHLLTALNGYKPITLTGL